MTTTDGARLRISPASRLAAVLAGGALLLAAAEHVHLSWREGGPDRNERRLTERIQAVQERAAHLGAELSERAVAAAALPESAAAIRGDREALSRLFGSLETVARSRDGQYAMAIRTPPSAVVAWSGPVSDLRGLERSAESRAGYLVLSGTVTTTLLATAPVRAPGASPGLATAEAVVRVQRNIQNEFLADFDLLTDGLSGVEVRYADLRDPTPTPFPPLPPGTPARTAALRTADGTLLGTIRATADGQADSDRAISRDYRRAVFAFGLAAILVWTCAAPSARFGRRARLFLGATAARLLLLVLGTVVTSRTGLLLAGSEVYASGHLSRLLGSPIDLLATAAWLTVVSALILDLVLRRTPATLSWARAGASLVGSLPLLAIAFLWVGDTVASSRLDLATVALVPKSPVHVLLQSASLLILASALLLLTALFGFAGPAPPDRGGRMRLALIAALVGGVAYALWPRATVGLPLLPALGLALAGLGLGISQTAWRPRLARADSIERTGLILSATVFLSFILYPSLVHYAEKEERLQIEREYMPLVLGQPARREKILQASERTVDDLRLLESESDVSPPGVDELAFAVWSTSELSEAGGSSAVEIQDAQGAVLSRFALDLPSLAATGPPRPLPAEDEWTTTRQTITVATAERRVLHARRRLTYDGQTRGAVHLYVGEDFSGLPFIPPRDPYSALYRTSPRRFVRAPALILLAYDASAVPVFSSAERPPPLTPELAARAARSPAGSWVTLPVENGMAHVLLFTDGTLTFALGFPRLGVGRYAAGLLEASVGLTLAVLAVLLGLMAVRTALGRPSFSLLALVAAVRQRFALRLFVAFVTLAVVPVAVLEGVVRRIVAARLEHLAEDQALERAAVAQKAVEDFALFQRREAPGTRLVTDTVLVWVASLIRNDLDVFGNGRLIASSKRGLYASGLLPWRISGSVFRDLMLEEAPAALRSERIGSFSSLVVSVPVRLEGPDPAILSIPLALRQRELQATLDELDRTIRLSSLGFLVVAAALAQSMSRRISGPLRALTAATHQVADGDLSARVETTNRDEILALVDSFNQMAGDLERQRRDLERSNRLAAWAEMARQVAHEVKNPLTPIQLSAEHLRRVYKDPSVDFDATLAACTDTILKQVRTLREIVTEFSAFARPPASAPVPEDVTAVVRAVLAPYERHLPPGVTLSLEGGEGLPPVRMDRRLVERALVNVVENALQAVQEKGSVVVRLRAQEAGRGVEVQVEDSGPGLTPEARERVFEPFFSTKTNGSGLGLALVKKIAEDHGGGVSLESWPGQGTRVAVWLPTEGVT